MCVMLYFCLFLFFVFFFKQKTAYEMRISDWSSDVCSSDLPWVAALYGPLWFWYYLLLLLLHGSRVQSGRDCGKSEAQRGLHSGYSSRQEYREISGFRADPHHRDRCSLSCADLFSSGIPDRQSRYTFLSGRH